MRIKKTQNKALPRFILYAPHKIGKTTFGANATNPLFICTERGADLLGVDAIEFDDSGRKVANSFTEVMESLRYIAKEVEGFTTLVFDSVDFLEKLIRIEVLNSYNKAENKSLKEFGLIPYGAGYKTAMDYWKRFTDGLDFINEKKGMMILLLAHSKIDKVEDPERPNYDQHTLDLHDTAAKHLFAWVDIIGFANEKLIVTEEKEGFSTVVKAKGSGARMLNLNKKPAYQAGNRYGLPDMELSYSLFWDALPKEVTSLVKGKEDESSSVDKGGTKENDNQKAARPDKSETSRSDLESNRSARAKDNESSARVGNLGQAAKAHEEDKAKSKEEIISLTNKGKIDEPKDKTSTDGSGLPREGDSQKASTPSEAHNKGNLQAAAKVHEDTKAQKEDQIKI